MKAELLCEHPRIELYIRKRIDVLARQERLFD